MIMDIKKIGRRSKTVLWLDLSFTILFDSLFELYSIMIKGKQISRWANFTSTQLTSVWFQLLNSFVHEA